MKKVNIITLLFIVLVLMLMIPNVSNAATEYTYSDTEQGIEWSYEIDDSNNIINLICKTVNVTGTVTIPSTIDGKSVISLKGYYANWDYPGYPGLTGVTIPDTITQIGSGVFANCPGLKTVTIPNSVSKISSNAFYKCTGLTSVTLSENLSSIGEYAFKGCSGLKNITIPNSVTTMDDGAFESCKGLKEVKLSEKLTKISEHAFNHCSGLESIILPDSVTTIELWAFSCCDNLKKILIPDSVASIDKNAFIDTKGFTIYGNDGQTSKSYAEANSINFKYISQWDESDVGDDITPPYVKSISVPNSSVSGYYDSNSTTYIVPSGKVLIINVDFNENILATEVPDLTIKFGSGSNIVLKEGTVSGSTIAYSYTIGKSDVGTMTAVSLSGGNVSDEAGNKATLSCPELKVSLSNYYIYANGTAIDVGDDNNNNKKPTDNNNNNNKPTDNNSNNNKPSNNNDSTNKKDDTTAIGKLPQTGVSYVLILTIVILLGGLVFAYFKYRNLRGI